MIGQAWSKGLQKVVACMTVQFDGTLAMGGFDAPPPVN
jgi:hypothetical protein